MTEPTDADDLADSPGEQAFRLHRKIQPYEELHQDGYISLEKLPPALSVAGMMPGDFGIQVAADGRVWVCIDGVAFIRFTPKRA